MDRKLICNIFKKIKKSHVAEILKWWNNIDKSVNTKLIVVDK